VNKSVMAKIALMAMVVMVGMFAFAPATFAAEGVEAGAPSTDSNNMGLGLLGIGAGLAVGLAGIGTGNAQANVGAGGTGAMAEKPELFTNVLILFAIPETIVILGFVIAIMLVGKI
jgi:V/A-type H+/Na+-transporting ATPase subunit K